MTLEMPITGRLEDGREDAPARARRGGQLGIVLVPNLGPRYSGVTSVIRATLPHLQRALDADLVGRPAGTIEPAMSLASVILKGFSPPQGVPFRIWHARRNLEMLLGLFMRSVLRQPIRLVFTSAGQRAHTGLTDWLIGKMDAIISTTEVAANFLHRPSVIIPHGIDCAVFRPVADREAAWAARGLGGQRGIGVFGRVRRQKGTDLFVEALIRLLPRYPAFTGVVVGLTKLSEAEFLAGLKRRVATAGLGERIVFLGELPPDDLPGWLASVSICVAPQRHEGFGLVPLEAAASGTPVVAARSGAADLIIEDGRTGLLVDAGDLDALTAAMERMMRDDALRTAMAEAARRRAVENFGIDRETAAYVEVYRSLWESGKVSPPRDEVVVTHGA